MHCNAIAMQCDCNAIVRIAIDCIAIAWIEINWIAGEVEDGRGGM